MTTENVLTFKLSSTRPLLMQAETLANPLSPLTKAHKVVAGKRKKSEDDYVWLLHSEWKASMYYDKELGPYMPAINIEACIAEAAKASKQGKLIKQALAVTTDRATLEYDGPRALAKMYGDGDSPFVDVRGVNVSGRKIMNDPREISPHPAALERLIEALARQAVQDCLREQAMLVNDSSDTRSKRVPLQRTGNAA